jgi:hypothetical protein
VWVPFENKILNNKYKIYKKGKYQIIEEGKLQGGE